MVLGGQYGDVAKWQGIPLQKVYTCVQITPSPFSKGSNMNKGYEISKDKLKAYNDNKNTVIRQTYNSNPRKCLLCNKDIPFEKRNNRFCNHTCAATHNNRKLGHRKSVKNNCLYCGELIDNPSKKYCSVNCMKSYLYKQYINSWIKGEVTGNTIGETVALNKYIRRWSLERASYKCEECGWDKINPTTGKRPLSVHHIDGNPYNTIPVNLKVLCPNCHSLTPTYGSLNLGNGRKGRIKK